MRDMGVARVAGCPAVPQGLTVERKLLLALAGLILTLILAQPCEGATPGNSPLDRPEEGQWRGNCLGLGGCGSHGP